MSPEQQSANRANAQLSTGPTSAAGKQIVSQNALRHGLAGSVHAALPGEEEAFEAHCEGFRDTFRPADIPEQAIVRNLAENYWRLKRAHAMESALFLRIAREQSEDLAPPAAHAEAWIDPFKGLQRIALYAARIQRAIEKNTAALEVLQARRKAAHAQAQDEAIMLSTLAEAHGQTYDPAPDFPPHEARGGFVYSPAEIARIVDRANRLDQAKALFEAARENAIM